MILTDSDIQEAMTFGEITIAPYNHENLGSNSYDLTLAPELMVYKVAFKSLYRRFIDFFRKPFGRKSYELDSKAKNETTTFVIPDTGYTLQPNILYLARTNETTHCSKCVPIIEGKSSIARLGISVHQTAGFGDVGFNGTWTLEMTVVHPTIIYPNIKIAQIAFHTTNGTCKVPYGSKKSAKYQNQIEIEPSKQYLNT